MHEMFEFPVRRTYELHMQQWQRARENKVKVKASFYTYWHMSDAIRNPIKEVANFHPASVPCGRIFRVAIRLQQAQGIR
jgi:hypothetical protein